MKQNFAWLHLPSTYFRFMNNDDSFNWSNLSCIVTNSIFIKKKITRLSFELSYDVNKLPPFPSKPYQRNFESQKLSISVKPMERAEKKITNWYSPKTKLTRISIKTHSELQSSKWYLLIWKYMRSDESKTFRNRMEIFREWMNRFICINYNRSYFVWWLIFSFFFSLVRRMDMRECWDQFIFSNRHKFEYEMR